MSPTKHSLAWPLFLQPSLLPFHSALAILTIFHSFRLAILCVLHSFWTCTPFPSPFFYMHGVPFPILQISVATLSLFTFRYIIGPEPCTMYDRADLHWQFFQGFSISWLSAVFNPCEVLMGSRSGLGKPGYSSCSPWPWTTNMFGSYYLSSRALCFS